MGCMWSATLFSDTNHIDIECTPKGFASLVWCLYPQPLGLHKVTQPIFLMIFLIIKTFSNVPISKLSPIRLQKYRTCRVSYVMRCVVFTALCYGEHLHPTDQTAEDLSLSSLCYIFYLWYYGIIYLSIPTLRDNLILWLGRYLASSRMRLILFWINQTHLNWKHDVVLTDISFEVWKADSFFFNVISIVFLSVIKAHL